MSHRFLCDHCGKKFELETPEAKECPFCFWTSSVKREDEAAASKKGAPKASSKTAVKPGGIAFSGVLKLFFRALLLILLLAGIGFLAFKAYHIFKSSPAKSWQAFSIKPPRESNDSKTPKAVTDPLALLTPSERETLLREVSVSADRDPDPGEQTILGRVVPFQTGWSEKLPSAMWTLEQYQKFITDQEAFYRMPFARSYRKKLEELFKAKYLGAADAFAKGDVLVARNLWVESLAFPLYSQDLKKHRAVALTMLRPYINDTLSKVSAMNQSIVDREKRVKEEALSREYQELSGLIAQKKWTEALTMIGKMAPEVDQLRKNAVPVAPPPPYPASFGTIDADLQRPLMDLMSPSPSTVADLQPLQQDLVEKKEIMETFTGDYLEKSMTTYRSALEMIRNKQWQEAILALNAIPGPQALQQDAAAKVAILQKIAGPALDSSEKTS
jgi:hypothetical protein